MLRSKLNLFFAGGLVCLAMFSLCATPVQAQGYINRIEYDWDNWETIAATLPHNAAFPAMVVYSNALYLIGGSGHTNVYRYSHTNQVWTEIVGLPQATYAAVAGVVGDSIYLAGGMNPAGSQSTNTVFRYNGTAWTQLDPMPECRGLAVGGVINGELYVSFGLDLLGGLPDTTYKFNGTTWTEHVKSAPAAYGGVRAGGTVVGTNLYVSGGYYGGYLNYFQRLSDTNWSRLGGDMSTPRAYHASAALGGKVYVIGGRTTAGVKTNMVYAFDVGGGAWDSPNPPYMPKSVDSLAAATYRGSIYMAGGSHVSDTNTYRYPAQSGSEGVIPESGVRNGGYQVAIIGTGLGNGSDITNVTLCGVSVSNIFSQSATQVVVAAGYSPVAVVTGDVRVFSTSVGETVLTNGFTYNGSGKAGQFITFAAIANQKITDTLTLSATASSGLTVSFSVVSGPATIGSGNRVTFSNTGEVSIKAAQAGNASYDPAPDVTRSFRVTSANPFTLRAVALTNSVVLRWPNPMDYGFSNQTVSVRFSTADYPEIPSSGDSAYTGTNMVYEHTGRTPGETTYYSIFTSNDGVNFIDPE